MTNTMDGLVLKSGWFGREFIPFDEMAALEQAAVRLKSGARHAVSEAQRGLVSRALSPPQVAGDLEADGAALRTYLSAAFSPERAVRALLEAATKASASDVHLESSEHGVVVQARLQGELRAWFEVPGTASARLFAALKHLSGCLPYRSDVFQEGRLPREGVAADVRTSFVPTAMGERAALRLFGALRTLEALGLDEASLASLKALLQRQSGLVLVAGSTGAGKTTTLYAALAHLAASRAGAHLSLEDPVEQRLRVAGIPVSQVELCPERGVTGESALVAALRQDIDVLAVGEVRTSAEAALALKAAHTGRLVLAGLHASSTHEAVQRLLDLGVDATVLEKTLVGVLHQRLVRHGNGSVARATVEVRP